MIYRPHIPYACGTHSVALRNPFRTHTEYEVDARRTLPCSVVFLRVYTKTSWHQYEDLPSLEVIHGKTLPNASPLLKSTRFPYKYPKIGIFTLVYYPRG